MSATATAGAAVDPACVIVDPDSKASTVRSLTAWIPTAPVTDPASRAGASASPDGWGTTAHPWISDSGNIFQTAPPEECLTSRPKGAPASPASRVIAATSTDATPTAVRMAPVRDRRASAPPDGSAIDARSRPVIRDACPMESVRMEPAPVIRDSMASIVPSMAAPPRARVTGSVSETRVTTMAVSLSGAASLSADVNQDGRVWTVLMSLKSIAMIILITITVSRSFCPSLSLSLSLVCSAQAFIFCRSILVSSLFDPFFFGFPRVSYCDISLPNDVSLSVTVLADSFQSVMKGRVSLLPASMIFFFVPSLLLPLLLRLRLSALSDSEMIPFYPSGFATSMTLLSVCVSMCVSA